MASKLVRPRINKTQCSYAIPWTGRRAFSPPSVSPLIRGVAAANTEARRPRSEPEASDQYLSMRQALLDIQVNDLAPAHYKSMKQSLDAQTQAMMDTSWHSSGPLETPLAKRAGYKSEGRLELQQRLQAQVQLTDTFRRVETALRQHAEDLMAEPLPENLWEDDEGYVGRKKSIKQYELEESSAKDSLQNQLSKQASFWPIVMPANEELIRVLRTGLKGERRDKAIAEWRRKLLQAKRAWDGHDDGQDGTHVSKEMLLENAEGLGAELSSWEAQELIDDHY